MNFQGNCVGAKAYSIKGKIQPQNYQKKTDATKNYSKFIIY